MSFGTPFYLKISEVHLVLEFWYLISISEEQKICERQWKKVYNKDFRSLEGLVSIFYDYMVFISNYVYGKHQDELQGKLS